MKRFNPLWVLLAVVAVLGALGGTGNLQSRMRDCIDRGGVWISGQGSRCEDRNREVERKLGI